jgi:histone H3/H4
VPESCQDKAADGHRPMLYSAESLRTIKALSERLGQALKRRALDRAKREGRNLVTAPDVWMALDEINQDGS